MKINSLLSMLGLLTVAPPARDQRFGKFAGRRRTHDATNAFPFRMNTGFAGDVNRTHPASIEPCLIDPSHYPTSSARPWSQMPPRRTECAFWLPGIRR